MEMPKPAEAHMKLEMFAGTWVGEETMHPSPWAPQGGKAQGRTECRLALNGFAVIGDYTQSKDGVTTFSGHSVHTWNTAEKCYTQHWFDCMGTPPEVFRGNFQGDVLTMTSRNPMGQMRSTSDYGTPGTLKVRMEMSQDGSKWQTLFEGTYKRG